MSSFLCLLLPLIFFCMAFAGPVAAAGSPGELFVQGVKAYDRGQYKEAASLFGQTADRIEKPGFALCYNLGNAWLKAGDLGRSVYWYERAKLQQPGNPDLLFNLKYARSMLKDIQEESISPWSKVFFFPNIFFSHFSVKVAFVVLNSLFWLLATGCLVANQRLLRGIRNIFLGLSLILLPAIGAQVWNAGFVKSGIVLPSEVAVRAGRDLDSTKLFVLHSGSRVSVKENVNGWMRISFGDDKPGWVPEDKIGILIGS